MPMKAADLATTIMSDLESEKLTPDKDGSGNIDGFCKAIAEAVAEEVKKMTITVTGGNVVAANIPTLPPLVPTVLSSFIMSNLESENLTPDKDGSGNINGFCGAIAKAVADSMETLKIVIFGTIQGSPPPAIAATLAIEVSSSDLRGLIFDNLKSEKLTPDDDRTENEGDIDGFCNAIAEAVVKSIQDASTTITGNVEEATVTIL
jgi:ABC-type amino acid transport substrate-binding protein